METNLKSPSLATNSLLNPKETQNPAQISQILHPNNPKSEAKAENRRWSSHDDYSIEEDKIPFTILSNNCTSTKKSYYGNIPPEI